MRPSDARHRADGRGGSALLGLLALGKPALRNVTTKLWRYDPKDGKHYVHSERNDNTTDPDVETLYSASCSSAGILYQFHTEAIVNAFNGNWDREPDNSSTIAAIC